MNQATSEMGYAHDIVSEESSAQAITLAKVALEDAFIKSERPDISTLQHFGGMIRLSSELSQQLRLRERETEHLQEALRSKENVINKLQAKVCEIESAIDRNQEEYENFIRKHQEESFKRMESARWCPAQGRKVVSDLNTIKNKMKNWAKGTSVSDLNTIKNKMKNWAKGTSVKDMSLLQTLDGMDIASLMKDLSRVALLENNQLPQGLSTPKSASLLLNALLAHDVYTTIFRSPFFFLNDGLGHDLPRSGLDDTMNKIYQLAQACKWTDCEETTWADYLS
jgi:hypothetical protein